jgi:hypothetical protein
MERRGSVLTGLGVGAGLMYLLDPTGGRRRRAVVRDRLTHGIRSASHAAGTTSRDVAHRATGLAARLRARARDEVVDDDILVERVRSRVGHVVAHPHAIEIKVRDGAVTLRGGILERELPRLVRAVGRVRGVRDVVNHLQLHTEADDAPALQGERTSANAGRGIMRREWSPRARFATGTVLAVAGLLILARLIRR